MAAKAKDEPAVCEEITSDDQAHVIVKWTDANVVERRMHTELTAIYSMASMGCERMMAYIERTAFGAAKGCEVLQSRKFARKEEDHPTSCSAFPQKQQDPSAPKFPHSLLGWYLLLCTALLAASEVECTSINLVATWRFLPSLSSWLPSPSTCLSQVPFACLTAPVTQCASIFVRPPCTRRSYLHHSASCEPHMPSFRSFGNMDHSYSMIWEF